MLAVVVRDRWKAGHVGGVVGEEFEVDLDVARTGHPFPVKVPRLRWVQLAQLSRETADVGVAGALEVEPLWQPGAVLRGWVSPECLGRLPLLAQPFLVGVAVLDP